MFKSEKNFKNKFKLVIDSGSAIVEKKQLGKLKGLRDVITIDDKSYRYDPTKPDKITKTLTKKINQVAKSDRQIKLQKNKDSYYKGRLENARNKTQLGLRQ